MVLSGILQLLNSYFENVNFISLGLGPPSTAWGSSPILSHYTVTCSELPLILVGKAVISPCIPRFLRIEPCHTHSCIIRHYN